MTPFPKAYANYFRGRPDHPGDVPGFVQAIPGFPDILYGKESAERQLEMMNWTFIGKYPDGYLPYVTKELEITVKCNDVPY